MKFVLSSLFLLVIAANTITATVYQGRVVLWQKEKGIGFIKRDDGGGHADDGGSNVNKCCAGITPDDGGGHVWVHDSALKGSGFKSLYAGECLKFGVNTAGKKIPEAVNIHAC
jgi:cold shock CspA family protein